MSVSPTTTAAFEAELEKIALAFSLPAAALGAAGTAAALVPGDVLQSRKEQYLADTGVLTDADRRQRQVERGRRLLLSAGAVGGALGVGAAPAIEEAGEALGRLAEPTLRSAQAAAEEASEKFLRDAVATGPAVGRGVAAGVKGSIPGYNAVARMLLRRR